jgi:hypothetical protein
MNYSAHYDRLIARARVRELTGYRERHHVLPRCMGGGDELENIVRLTAEEHYVAHQLLVKMHPRMSGLVWAALRLARGCRGNKAYGWLRRRYSKARSGKQMSLETKAKISAYGKGREKSAEHKAKIGAAHLGMKKPALTVEHRAQLSALFKGRKMPPRPPEHCAKISARAIGNKRMLGKHHSETTRTKISASRKGIKLSSEHVSRLREGHRLYYLSCARQRFMTGVLT